MRHARVIMRSLAERRALHPQLVTILEELRAARARLHRLAAEVPAEQWARRTDPDRWSVAECVEHLNLTGRAYLPLLRGAVDRAREIGGPAPRRYRRDPVGWLLWKTMGPPVRFRVRTTAEFVPGAEPDREALIAEFDRLQEEQIRLTEAADGLPLHRVRVRSPFDPRVRYNAYSCFSILPAHQHRHLWQAERALAELRITDR